MIPKIIHLCWLSGEVYPPLIEKCIESWKQKLPDYTIKIWDTNTIDIKSNLWLQQAFTAKKYAFAADYIRFYALYNDGGIYLDADVEILKSFDNLLHKDYFIGEEAGGDVEAAVMGCKKGMSWMKDCLDYYTNRSFILPNGLYDTKPVPLLLNKIVAKYNLEVYPHWYFSPKNYNTEKIDTRAETYTIHHFDGKWVKRGIVSKIKKNVHNLIYKIFGRKGHIFITNKVRMVRFWLNKRNHLNEDRPSH